MAGLPSHTRVINGTSYETTTLDAIKGRSVFLRLLKVLGGGASSAAERVQKGSIAAGVSGIAGAIERLSDEDLTFFVEAFCPMSTVALSNGNRVPLPDLYAVHFAGKMKEHMAWLLFCVEVNYADFFGDARAQLAEIWEMVMAQILPKESPSSSPTESTGGSGDSSAPTE